MTDATLKEALAAVTKLLPDTHFAILLVVEIPPFGQSKVGPIDIMTTAGAQQVREIIVGLSRSIEQGNQGSPREVAREPGDPS